MGVVEQKTLGAFYTDASVADFLVNWAIRSGNDTVLDPAFGGGVFLRSAARRISSLGGNSSSQVFGVEIDKEVHTRTRRELEQAFRINASNLVQSDFFDLSPDGSEGVTAIVGNPPFIRYQRFSSIGGQKALAVARAHGASLSALSSSWAPFLIHATAFVKSGGRLAMVVPAEIGHAAYARPIVSHLAEHFASVTLITFNTRLFPHLNEDTHLLLADEKGFGPSTGLKWAHLEGPEDLARLTASGLSTPMETRLLGLDPKSTRAFSLAEASLPGSVRDLFQELRSSGALVRLGQLADVGIGYVTGGNEYFHLNLDELKEYQVPDSLIRRAVRRGRDLRGVRYTEADWLESALRGEKVHLLLIPPNVILGGGVSQYLQKGIIDGVSQAYKCRTRTPWYSIPYVHCADALLTYMSGAYPKLVCNEARVVAPNTLHVIRLLPGFDVSARALAVLWQSSLTRLSAELEGHSLGGGLLKLEPTEAERVLLPFSTELVRTAESIAEEVDRLSRSDRVEIATELVDRELLVSGLALSRSEVLEIKQAAEMLWQRRQKGS